MSQISAPVSFGELIDKITILQIKSERMTDPDKLNNVRHELDVLTSTWDAAPESATDIRDPWARLKAVNEALWEIEDDIRDEERAKRFGERFVELARAVYVTNDQRAALKKEINVALGSDLVEEKSYADYS